MNRVLDTLTPGKVAWLEKLERRGIAARGRGPVGRNCMVNGWTEWAVTMPGGDEVRDWFALTPDEREDLATLGIQPEERLTPAGRERLAQYRKQQENS
ncbi:hypothetical protein QH494_16105 [Sphingomonas sp. AR_OL41]|uniref:hypothetical protein n=1 Tax=Sphingomonas sp. AR_OL41 TaxID=3042729 RepID=UPI00247FCB0D|nr:hypothetical protein [Sphingomonas sp. AR_OL41]MDH7973716.1 hypothetical protein [Sphingomonas sp. AR_OL41]